MSITTYVLKDIISRCHRRHGKPRRQRKTSSIPRLYKGFPYHFTVYCAHEYPVLLRDLESAGISFMPIGKAPGTDRPPRGFKADRFLKRQQLSTDWHPIRWHRSWGIHIYTGLPSARDDAPWHDINFEYESICAHPEAVLACVTALVAAVDNPLLTLTKSGGLRFSCRIQGYLHPSTERTSLSLYDGTPTAGGTDRRIPYIELVGEEGHTCWDARYEILLGDLLDPPVVSKEIFFSPLDALGAALRGAVSQSGRAEGTLPDISKSFGSCRLDLAKEALLKHGFSYMRESEGVHYWEQRDAKTGNREVSMWESEGGVWVRAATSGTQLPTEATLITDIWDDTGILPPIPETELVPDDKARAMQAGELSPLAVKRPSPILHKSTEKVEETQESISIQARRAFDNDARVVGLITDTNSERNQRIESLFQHNESICLNVESAELAVEAEQYFRERHVEPMACWRDRMYLWDQVKDIPVDIRMAAPFERGNVCEDPERCESLVKKGGDPSESICPSCPVYTACQERGYLSQIDTLQTAKLQITEGLHLFLDPQSARTAEQLLEAPNGTQRLCVINTLKEHRMFPTYKLSKRTLKEWVANWKGGALGSFAGLLLNAAGIRDQFHADSTRRIRAAVQTFEWLKEEIIQQMCHVKVRGRVVERKSVDAGTGEDLAHYAIEFDRGISAYIPLNSAAADRLAAQEVPLFQLDTFVLDQDMDILMPIADTIRLGILDASTPENIEKFPTVYADPNWTLWHQLKHFFSHYTRDADAPIQWEGEVLQFSLPPVLHPGVKQLLVTCPVLSSEYIHRTFSNENVEIIRSEPATWVPGNRVFQIRTDIYPRHAIVDVKKAWDTFGVTEAGQHILWKIQAEIQRDPGTTHGIVVYPEVIKQIEELESYENVCFLTIFREVDGLATAFEEADVVWIIGMPDIKPNITAERSQILFGNDEAPLFYEIESASYRYKDKRTQSVYEKTIYGVFAKITEMVQLNRLSNKKVMLITAFRVPGITDRPETLLFDWADLLVAGGLDKLAEAIGTRQKFEAERETLSSESSRKEVERVLGCSTRQANRILRRMGRALRVTFRQQILTILAEGKKTTPEIVAAIEGHPKAINTELTRLVNIGEIVKIKRGLYTLPEK